MAPRQTVLKGLAAGLIAAAILALWFLIIDVIQGQPFHTPAFLAKVLLNVNGAERSLIAIIVYTLVHIAAFASLGIGMAFLLRSLEASPPIVLGLVLGFVLFDLVFYLGIVLTGVDVVQELGWPQVLSGNLMAGVGLCVYLSRSLGLSSPDWLWSLTQHDVVREGFLLGIVGAVTVALWFLLVDLVRGQLFFTPGALGSALFLDAMDVGDVRVSLLTVGGYTIVHLTAFLVVGLAVAAIAIQAEKFPPLLLAGVLIFASFEAFFLGGLALLAEWLMGAIGWVSIGVGNLLATLVVAYLLWLKHPKLRAAITKSTLFTEDGELP